MSNRYLLFSAISIVLLMCIAVFFIDSGEYTVPFPVSVPSLHWRLDVPSREIKDSNERYHAQDCPPKWKAYADKFEAEIHGDSKGFTTADGLDFSQTSSPKFSKITILNKRSFYNICDVLLVRIQSRDWNDRPKTYGGDFFRTKIFHQKPYSAASEDVIIDFLNGTYLALFTLRWTGEVKVLVKLIHPVEVLPQLLLTLSGKVGQNITFAGKFVSGKISEEVICRYNELPGPMCNLSNPRTHGPWYCQRPTNKRLSCKDWRFHKMYKGTFLKLADNLPPLTKELLNRSYMVEIPNSCKVKVADRGSDNNSSRLPFCTINGVPNGVHTAGHFYEDIWYPDNCKIASYSPKSGIKCLRNKNVVILGDSTARQIFTFFKDKYKRYFKTLPLPKGAWGKFGPTDIESKEYNASVQYRFHGLPRAGTNLVLRTDFIELIADRLNSGRDGCNVVYVISVWAHFIATGSEFYERRLMSIKSAIKDFLDRCPNGRVIIKSANTKAHPALWIAIISSEWNILKHERLLREVFQDETRVGFIDAWDLTKVQQYEDFVHPDIKIVKQLVDRLLTYICKR